MHVGLVGSNYWPRNLSIHGDDSNVREWIYVEENCRAIEAVRKDGDVGEVYNIGSGEERTNLEVAHEVLDAVDADADLIEDRPGHDQRYAFDSSKLEAIGWQPSWSFEE
jgi:dTDP-glucose 4,6-dehydratase